MVAITPTCCVCGTEIKDAYAVSLVMVKVTRNGRCVLAGNGNLHDNAVKKLTCKGACTLKAALHLAQVNERLTAKPALRLVLPEGVTAPPQTPEDAPPSSGS